MRTSQVPSRLSFQRFIKAFSVGLFRHPLKRKVVCLAVAFILLLGSGLGLAGQHIRSLASRALDVRIALNSNYEAFFLSSLFSQANSVTQHETMSDRASAVAHIHLNPVKFVGYVDETITFTALATDFLDRTIQGVKFTWTNRTKRTNSN